MIKKKLDIKRTADRNFLKIIIYKIGQTTEVMAIIFNTKTKQKKKSN